MGQYANGPFRNAVATVTAGAIVALTVIYLGVSVASAFGWG
jgi:hypothetical protein